MTGASGAQSGGRDQPCHLMICLPRAVGEIMFMSPMNGPMLGKASRCICHPRNVRVKICRVGCTCLALKVKSSFFGPLLIREIRWCVHRRPRQAHRFAGSPGRPLPRAVPAHRPSPGVLPAPSRALPEGDPLLHVAPVRLLCLSTRMFPSFSDCLSSCPAASSLPSHSLTPLLMLFPPPLELARGPPHFPTPLRPAGSRLSQLTPPSWPLLSCRPPAAYVASLLGRHTCLSPTGSPLSPWCLPPPGT